MGAQRGKQSPGHPESPGTGDQFFQYGQRHSIGASEEILGRALKDFAKQDEVVIATKVQGKMHEGPNGSGLSRKAILSEIDKSLQRLETDYVDLYQIHRWDYQTPIEETMEALNGVVRAGKARYIGASAMWAWQFQKALHVAEKHGWTRFVSMQNHLNLLYREEEREMLPLCRAEKIGVIPYSPLASGRLTRDWSSEPRFVLKPIKSPKASTMRPPKPISTSWRGSRNLLKSMGCSALTSR
jgi:aryl-alcohol dehydrogenase-like predicted oxidoreductase